MWQRKFVERDYAKVGTLGRAGSADPSELPADGRFSPIADIALHGRFRRLTRERTFSLLGSAAFHLTIALVIILWRDRPPAQHEVHAIQVEFLPPSAARPVNDDSKHAPKPTDQEPAFVPPTTDGEFAAPLKLDPTLRLDSSRKANLDKTPPADSGSVAHGDPLQNYGVMVGDMVSRHVLYPDAARTHHEQGIVKVSLTLSRDGSMLDVHAETPGRQEFADAAIEAAYAAAPFPRFPPALNRSSAVIVFAIVFEDPDIKQPAANGQLRLNP